MLSYQHAYHAGNMADVHKHAALCCVLDYLMQKDKPLSFIDTHSGRGIYRLDSDEALKTGEARLGITRMMEKGSIPQNHPYYKTLMNIKNKYGENVYPGSPLIAANMLREVDKIHLAEMHPQEIEALRSAMQCYSVRITKKDGLKHANRLIPPEPRRGLMLIDPSYEIKSDYMDMAEFILKMQRKWNGGIIMLWYPILEAGLHLPMLEKLEQSKPENTLTHEIDFSNANNPEHRMKGSGLYLVNPPFGLENHLKSIEGYFNI